MAVFRQTCSLLQYIVQRKHGCIRGQCSTADTDDYYVTDTVCMFKVM